MKKIKVFKVIEIETMTENPIKIRIDNAEMKEEEAVNAKTIKPKEGT